MPPIVPDDLTTLSAAALRQLANDISTYASGVLTDASADRDTKAGARALIGARAGVLAALATAEAEEAADAAAIAELEDAPTPEPAPAPVAPVVEVVPASEVEVVPAAAAASAVAAASPGTATGIGVPSEAGPAASSMLSQFRAGANVDTKKAGEGFDSWAELSSSIAELANLVSPGSEKQFQVASVKGDYPEERRITGDSKIMGLSRMDPAEITAAYCPPSTPYYALACQNTMRRPVFNSLPQFEAPRGRVSIPNSPTLQDLQGQATGYGKWTIDDDTNVNSTKNCAVVQCNSWTDYQMYAVWRCLTVKNLMFMTYPELVEHYLMLLGAAWARSAETMLLDAMATGAVTVNADALGYGAATTLTTTLLQYLALYQETQRWDLSEGMEVWAPRYLQTGIKIDLLRRRQINGGVPTVPTDAQIDAIFANAGFTMHWTLDTASWMIPVASVQSGGILNKLPTSTQMLIAPKGKFALIDRGELSIGVNGNNLYRDTVQNTKNQFTLFFESFEGIVNTTSCPAHLLNIPLCFTGIQVDDQLVNCAGQNMPAFQS